jgi:transcriptional regulator GlxA family with amidase domain
MEKGDMNIGILLFDDVEVLDFCGPFEVFSVAAKIGAESGGDPPFTVFTVAERAGLVRAAGGLKVQPDYTIDHHPPINLLLVPGGWGTRREVDNSRLINWIRAQDAQTELTTSVCTGAFLLGRAGLLEGHGVRPTGAASNACAVRTPVSLYWTAHVTSMRARS